MSPTRVGVIGAGIAGPILATLLKLRGYEPVVFERNPAPSEGGVGIGLQMNGLRVLNQIPGLLDALPRFLLDEFHFCSVIPEDEAVLGVTHSPKKLREEHGERVGTFGIRRHILQRKIVEFAEQSGVEFKWNHHCENLEQQEDSVTVAFANGVKETFSFVVGCDGLHSNVRISLFGKQAAEYTGMSQFGGYSPAPDNLKGKPIGLNLFGDGAHMLAVPVDAETIGFSVTQREAEAKETWRALDAEGVEEIKKSSIREWAFGGGEIIQNAYGITKYGLYDRPELKTWHQSRVVLIGDAAHPTSPHLGQGANQSFEDASLLVELLQKYNPSAEEPSTATLEIVFSDLEKVRIPRSSEMVKGARAQGESRVVHGTEACIKRNNWYRDWCKNQEATDKRFGKFED